MKNLYVYRDTVSGNTGAVFEAENDAVMRRNCIPSLASVPPHIARDTVVLHVGTIELDLDNMPIVQGCVPRMVLSGMSDDIAACRLELMSEARKYGGDADAES